MVAVAIVVTFVVLGIQDRILRRRNAKRALDEQLRRLAERPEMREYLRDRIITDPYRQSAHGDALDDAAGFIATRPASKRRMSKRSRKAADAWIRERYLESANRLPPSDEIGPDSDLYTTEALIQRIERLNDEIRRLAAAGDVAGIKQRQRRRYGLHMELDRRQRRNT